jgi:AmiR/NasT family two-component response regulator
MHIVVSGIAAAEELEDVVKRVNPDVVLTGIDAEALKPPYRSFLFTSRSVPIIAIRERDDTFEIFSRRACTIHENGNPKEV